MGDKHYLIDFYDFFSTEYYEVKYIFVKNYDK